jgi:hypothetical protein
MDVMIDNEGNLLRDIPINYANALINVSKNYVYEDPKMLNTDIAYQRLYDLSYLMDNSIKNSHDIVSHWMIQMNMFTGSYMASNRIGVFRSAVYINSNLRVDAIGLKEDTVRVIRNWNNTVGQYFPFMDDISIEHELIKSKSFKNESKVYVHITSPIRRLVDLLNQIILLRHNGLVKNISSDSLKFLEDWIRRMDYVNTSMRSIRKIQTECELLNKVYNHPEFMDIEHDGVVFDKIVKNDGSINYMIYLEKLKLLSRINTHGDIPNYAVCKCKMYLFEDEDKVHRKIKVQVIS